jgi:hypothetical protein
MVAAAEPYSGKMQGGVETIFESDRTTESWLTISAPDSIDVDRDKEFYIALIWS